MGDDSDWQRYTRRGAVGVMGAGGLLAVSETFGFTRLTADRGTDIGVTGDSEDSVALYITDDDGDSIQESYTGTVELSIGNNTNADISESEDDISVEFTHPSSGEAEGSEKVSINTSDFSTENGSVSSGESETLDINSDSGPWKFKLSITDTTSDSNEDIRNALEIDISVTANLEGTQIELTRTTTIQDQQP